MGRRWRWEASDGCFEAERKKDRTLLLLLLPLLLLFPLLLRWGPVPAWAQDPVSAGPQVFPDAWSKGEAAVECKEALAEVPNHLHVHLRDERGHQVHHVHTERGHHRHRVRMGTGHYRRYRTRRPKGGG